MTSLSSLTEYGHSFQIKLISSLLSDKTFLLQIGDIIEPEYFDSEANVFISEMTRKYFQKYQVIPSLEVLASEVKKIDNNLLKESIKQNLKEAFKQINSEDLSYIKEEALKFCKNQVLKKAIEDSVELLEIGKYDEIKAKIDSAMRAGIDKNLGHNYKKEIKERYETDKRFPVKIGWDPIDEITGGGLGAGELGVVVGGPGSGKTWSLINIAANAINEGKFVIYYTLELGEDYIAKRFDAFNTGISSQNLKYHIEDIEKKVNSTKGELFVKYFPTKSASINTLIAHIERVKLLHGKPDLIIVDYADLLKGIPQNKNERTDEILNNIYAELRGIAGQFECPSWTGSQANRSSSEQDIVTGDKIEGAWSKLFVADFVISLSRKVEDKISGTGRFHIIKNRLGPDGLVFPSKINFSNGRMNIYESSTIDGKETQKSIDNSEFTTRKYLGSKLKELGISNGKENK